MDNEIFLFKSACTETLCIAIGNGNNKRRVWLTDYEALQLAYKLMSLGKGGDTHGMERMKFE